MDSLARRMFQLVEPIPMVTFTADEPNEAMAAIGFSNYWDGYFAGRAGPFGREAPAEVIHALFYNFADGEVARHIPSVWDVVSPEQAIEARLQGAVDALRRILGDACESASLARAADLLTKAATSAPMEGRPMLAALRALPIPAEPVPRLWHSANMLREHRGDGHIAALVSEGIGGTEAHVLLALHMGMPAEKFGRVHHLPSAQLADVIAGMRNRGLVDDAGWLTDTGRECKQRVESLTDDLAAPAYDGLSPAELDQLIADLSPIAAALDAENSL